MAKKEILRVKYPCELLGETTHVILEYLYYPTGSNKVLLGFDCEGCYNCGVGKEGPSGQWTFDWGKCIHPKSPNR